MGQLQSPSFYKNNHVQENYDEDVEREENEEDFVNDDKDYAVNDDQIHDIRKRHDEVEKFLTVRTKLDLYLTFSRTRFQR